MSRQQVLDGGDSKAKSLVDCDRSPNKRQLEVGVEGTLTRAPRKLDRRASEVLTSGRSGQACVRAN